MALTLSYLLTQILLQNSKNVCSMYLHVPPKKYYKMNLFKLDKSTVERQYHYSNIE